MVESTATGMHNLAYERVERKGSRFTVLNTLELAAGSALLLMIVVMVLWQAISRYYPAVNWAGAGELARYGLVALTFILVGYLFGSGGHITITILDARLKPVGQAILKIVGALFVLVIASVLVWSAVTLLFDPFTHSRTTSVVRIPITYVVLIPLIGFSLMILRVVETIVIQAKIVFGGR
jgi:TRAP-type C4-dicarboxylate transport system permease small subunit